MNKEKIETLTAEMDRIGGLATKAVREFLALRGAYSVHLRITSLFEYGGQLCDGPFAMLEASFLFKSTDLSNLLGFEELASIKVKRYDVPGFNDGVYTGVAKLMYNYRKDKAYFFGG
jgi:hypothetical protein